MIRNLPDAPSGCVNDREDAPSPDHLTDFEGAVCAAVKRQALKTAAMSPHSKFALRDIEVTCIEDHGRVRVLISAQSEVTLDIEDVRDIDEGIGTVACDHGHLWTGIR
jgi:hypothetical protein